MRLQYMHSSSQHQKSNQRKWMETDLHQSSRQWSRESSREAEAKEAKKAQDAAAAAAAAEPGSVTPSAEPRSPRSPGSTATRRAGSEGSARSGSNSPVHGRGGLGAQVAETCACVVQAKVFGLPRRGGPGSKREIRSFVSRFSQVSNSTLALDR